MNRTSFLQTSASRANRQATEQSQPLPSVVIIEPALSVYNQIRFSLEPEVIVCQVSDGFSILPTLLTEPPHLIVLGPTLPTLLAYELCGEIRKRSHVPLVMLTEHYQTEFIVQAYELGADGVISLPFIYQEVQARLMAILRRAQEQKQASSAAILTVGTLALNDATHTVTVDEQPISVTPLHYQLLRYLMQHINQTVDKEQLLLKFWRGNGSNSTNVLEVAIRRLRQKIEPNPARPTYLITVKGKGYQLTSANSSTRPLYRTYTSPN